MTREEYERRLKERQRSEEKAQITIPDYEDLSPREQYERDLKRRNAQMAQESLVRRASSLEQKNSSIYADIYRRYQGQGSPYREDAAEWYDKLSSASDSYQSEYNKMLASLNRYNGYIDEDWKKNFTDYLNAGKTYYDKALEQASADKEFESQFGSQYAYDNFIRMQENKQATDAMSAEEIKAKAEEEKNSQPMSSKAYQTMINDRLAIGDYDIADLQEKMEEAKKWEQGTDRVLYYDQNGFGVTYDRLYREKIAENTWTNLTSDTEAYKLYEKIKEEEPAIMAQAQSGEDSQTIGNDMAVLLADKQTLSQMGYDYDEISYYQKYKADKEGYQESIKDAQNANPIKAAVFSIASAPLQSAEYAGNAFYSAMSLGNEDSAYGLANVYDDKYGNKAKIMLQGATQMIDDYMANKGRSQLARWLVTGAYSGVVSSAQSMAQVAACRLLFPVGGEAISLALMASNAANQQFAESIKAGATNGEALLTSIGAGVNEALFEKLSIENLDQIDDIIKAQRWNANSFGEFFKSLIQNSPSMLVQGLTEGSEEFFTDIANAVWDNFVNGSNSEYHRTVKEYMDQGYDSTVAGKMATQKFFADLASSFYGGFVGGLGSGSTHVLYDTARIGVNNTLGAYALGREISNNNNVDLLINQANELGDASIAQRVQRISQTENPSNRQIGRLAQEVYAKSENNIIQEHSKAFATEIESKLSDLSDAERKQAVDVVSKYQRGEFLTTKERKLFAKVGGKDLIESVTKDEEAMKRIRTSVEENPEIAKNQERLADAELFLKGDVKEMRSAEGSKAKEAIDKAKAKAESAKDVQTAKEETAQAFMQEMGYRQSTINAVMAEVQRTGKDIKDIGGFLLGVNEAINFGKIGYQQKYIKNNSYYGLLTQAQKNYAYQLGVDARNEQLAEEQARRDGKLGTLAKKTGKVHLMESADKAITELAKSKNKEDQARFNAVIKARDVLSFITQKITHGNIYLFASEKTADGKYVVPEDLAKKFEGKKERIIAGEIAKQNGIYDSATGDIYIDVNAGNNYEGVILMTAAHELTHFIRDWSPVKFRVLGDFLIEQYQEANVPINELIQRRIARTGDSYDLAYEETVADSMERMLTDKNVYDKILALKAKDNNLFLKLKAGLEQIVESIKNAYRQFEGNQTMEGYFATTIDNLDRLQTLFAEALVDAGEAFSRAEKQELASMGVVETDGSLFKNSIKTWAETDIDKLIKDLTNVGYDKSLVRKWIQDVNGVARFIANNNQKLNYKAADNQSALKDDEEYYVTIDFSTLCAKRLLYQGTFNAIQHALPDYIITPSDTLLIRYIMDKLGHEVPCGFCYVESRRKNLDKFASKWLGQGNRKKYGVNLADLTTTDGLEILRMNKPDAYDAFMKWMKGRGSAYPKVVELRTEYGENTGILNLSKAKIKMLRKIGGLRLQSFSDFEIPHIIDMMQVVMDMARMQMPSQAYTKVPELAYIFGNTGIKINLSVVADLDENGNLVFDDKEGMPHEEALKLREMYDKNCGTILVGKNEAQVRVAMEDDRIDFIIPFHRSGWSGEEFAVLGLTGYSDFQEIQGEFNVDYSPLTKNRKKAGGFLFPEDYWDYTASGDENTINYLNKCRELNRVPRFLNLAFKSNVAEAFVKEYNKTHGTKLTADDILTNEGMAKLCRSANEGKNLRQIAFDYLQFGLDNYADDIQQGYWKTLIDFRMYDKNGNNAIQENVRPDFNMDYALKFMSEYDEDPDTLPIAQDVVDEVVKIFEGGQSDKIVEELKARYSKEEIDRLAHPENVKSPMQEWYEETYGKPQVKLSVREIEEQLSINFDLVGKIKTQSAQAISDIDSIKIEDSTLKDKTRTLAVRFKEDLINKGNVSLVGQIAKSSDDLAVIAQVFRDPRFETLRYFFTDENGKIVLQSALTSGVVDASSIVPKNGNTYLAKMFSNAKKLGAEKMYLLHNHPSGDPTPSSADHSALRRLSLLAGHYGIAESEGVVIDSNKYSVFGEGASEIRPLANTEDELLSGEGNKDLLGRITSPDDLATIAKKIQLSDGYSAVIFLGTKSDVQAVQEISNDILAEEVELTEYVENGMSNFGATRVAFVTPKQKDYLNALNMYKIGLAVDVIKPAGDLYMSAAESNTRQLSNGRMSGFAEEVKFSTRDTEGRELTTAQQRYFKDSMVRDADGNLKVVYHGTDRVFTEFDNRGGSAGIFFTDDLDVANGYAGLMGMGEEGVFNPSRPMTRDEIENAYDYYGYSVEFDGGKITVDDGENHFTFNSEKEAREHLIDNMLGYDFDVPSTYGVYLNLVNPLIIDADGSAFNSIKYNSMTKNTDGWVDYARDNGYDGVIFNDVLDGVDYSNVYVALEPNQIKDTYNENPTENEDIRFSERVKQDISSADTSLDQIPALFTDKRVKFGKTNIDIGGGKFDRATNYLAEQGTTNYVFDPFNRDAGVNRKALDVVMNGGADTATCANVLNVIAEKEARENVILEVAKSIKPDGTAYFMVYEGDGSGVGRETSKGYQNNRKTADYVDEIAEYFDDVERKGKLIIATNPKENLPKASWELSPDNVVKYSLRDPSMRQLSDRELLMNAENAHGEIQEKRLAEFKEKNQLLESLKDDLKKSNDKDMSTKLRNRIDVVERQVVALEKSKVLQNILSRERDLAEKKRQDYVDSLNKQYRDRMEKQRKALMSKYRERKNKARERRTATDLRHRITKKIKELNKLLLHPDSKHHVPSGMESIVAKALDVIDFNNPRQSISTMMRLIDLKEAYEKFKTVQDPRFQYAYDEAIANMIDIVKEDIGDTPFQKLSVDQLTSVLYLYTAVDKTIRNANKTFIWAKQQDIIELSEDVMSEVKRIGGSKELTAKWKDWVTKNFYWNNMKPIYAMRAIGSDTLMKLFENVRRGEDTFANDVTDANQFFEAQAKKYGYDDWDLDERTEFKTADGKSFSLNVMEMMSLYEYYKRPQADAHLRQGGFVFEDSTIKKKNALGIPIEYKVNKADTHRIDPQIMAAISKKLTPEQKNFADAMQKYLAEVMGAKGNEVSEALYDIDLYTEEHYFPLKSSKIYLAPKATETAGDKAIKNAGITKALVPNANNPIILQGLMDVWADHVNEMSMYHAFVLPLEDFQRVYNYKTSASDENASPEGVKSAIINAYGDAADSYIRQMLVDLNGGARVDPRAGLSNKLISVFKKGAVLASASVVIQQPSAVVRAFAYIDPKYFLQTSLSNLKLKEHSKEWEEVKRYAPVAKIKEMGYFDTGMGTSTQEWIKERTPEGFANKAKALVTDSNYRDAVLSKAPELADEITWTHIWKAAKAQTLAENPSLKEGSEEHLEKAGELFTKTVVNTQVYDSVLSRSAMMRSKDGLVKTATAFMAEPTTSINMVVDALIQAKRMGSGKEARRIIASVLGQIILNAMLVSIVYAARDDDDEKTYVEKYIGQLAKNTLDNANPMTMIPYLKDIVSLMQGYDVERADMSVIADVIQAYRKLTSGEMSFRKVEDFTGQVLKLFGIPFQNVIRDVRGIENVINGFMSDNTTSLEGIRESVLEEVTGKSATKIYGNDLKRAVKSGDTAKIKSVIDKWVKQKMKSGKTEKEAKSSIQSTLTSTYKPLFLKAYEKGDMAEMARIRRALNATGIYKDVVKTTQDWIKSSKE